MKDQGPAECYENASKELLDAEWGVILDLYTCWNMSQVYDDVQSMERNTSDVIAGVGRNVSELITGVAECLMHEGHQGFQCAVEYVREKMKGIAEQRPLAMGKSYESVGSWDDDIRNTFNQFKTYIEGKAQDLSADVNSTEKRLVKMADTFMHQAEENIKSLRQGAMKDIDVLKNKLPTKCYQQAAKELAQAEKDSLSDLFACKNMSKAYKDIAQIGLKTLLILGDIGKDTEIIIEGILCAETGMEGLYCLLARIGELIKNIFIQWPEARKERAENLFLMSRPESSGSKIDKWVWKTVTVADMILHAFTWVENFWTNKPADE
ncbi:unnamed protein product [Nesidiocoris tenuis]|uniref:Uncharacterized protein n=1 Tax=Nesidiocoris tenuis TaxID=355587 RepID=A0A6H5FYZ4_9HEMI|nr:unnamed protein product [Nesidiocoris tenuis]